jgi:hypothetical protein
LKPPSGQDPLLVTMDDENMTNHGMGMHGGWAAPEVISSNATDRAVFHSHYEI